MGSKTGISWTDATWNPIRGCSRVSKGCEHCYAETMAHRFSGSGQPYEGLIHVAPNGEPRWNGKVTLVEKHILDPLRWKKPKKIFVNSMSDLFHENIPDKWIDKIFAVMALAPQHTFQILTKRPERMLEYLVRLDNAEFRTTVLVNALRLCMKNAEDFRRDIPIPLPNVWLGVSCEDQATADERIPILLRTPTAMRWVSAEPLLGPIRLDGRHGWYPAKYSERAISSLDWIVIGGESGPKARPFDLGWARDIVRQCKAAGAPVFVKQMGSNAVDVPPPPPDGRYMPGERPGQLWRMNFISRKAEDPAEWPQDLRIQEWPR